MYIFVLSPSQKNFKKPLHVFTAFCDLDPVVWWRHKKWLPGLDWQYIRREIDTNRLIVSLVSDHLTGNLDQSHNQKIMQNIWDKNHFAFWPKFSLVDVKGGVVDKIFAVTLCTWPQTWWWDPDRHFLSQRAPDDLLAHFKKYIYTVFLVYWRDSKHRLLHTN